MEAIINIKYQLKDNTSSVIRLKYDFSDDVIRSEFALIAMKLLRGGYIALIEMSKLISSQSNGKTIINPIHINRMDIICMFGDNTKMSLEELLKISGDCDLRKFPGIDWIQIHKNKSTADV